MRHFLQFLDQTFNHLPPQRSFSLLVAVLFSIFYSSAAVGGGFESSVDKQSDEGSIHCLTAEAGKTVLGEIERDGDYNALISFDYDLDPDGLQDVSIYATCNGDPSQSRIHLGDKGLPFHLSNFSGEGKSGRAVLHLHGSPYLNDKVTESAVNAVPGACDVFTVHAEGIAMDSGVCLSDVRVASWQYFQNTHEFWIGENEDDNNIPFGTPAFPPDPDRPHNIAKRDIPNEYVEIESKDGEFTSAACNIEGENANWPPYDGHDFDWKNIQVDVSPQTDIVPRSEIYPRAEDKVDVTIPPFVPVVRNAKSQYALQYQVDDLGQIHFRMCLDATPPNPEKPGHRMKARVEVSNCYANEADGSLDGWNNAEQEFQRAISNIYGQCVNVGADQTRWYYFEVYIPAVSQNSDALIAQWHGRPDRTLYQVKGADGKLLPGLHTLTQNEDYDATLRNKNNVFEQGGYPPIGLHLDHGKLQLWVRSDGRRFSDSSAKCRPTSHSKTNCINGNPKTGLQQVRLFPEQGIDVVTDKWLGFMVGVTWSRYMDKSPDPSGQVPGTHGVVKAAMAYWPDDATEPVVEILARNYEGAVGRFDSEKPYFKMGIYAPSGTSDAIRISSGNYRQSENCLHANPTWADYDHLCAALGEPY